MKLIYVVFFGICFYGCAGRNKVDKSVIPTADWSKYEKLTVVDMRSLDGCGFLLAKNESTLLNPLNLPDSLSKNGKVIWVKYILRNDKMTTCMSGKTIQIEDVKLMQK